MKADVKGKIENSVKAGRLCHTLFPYFKSGQEVVVMDTEYIISFMIILLLLVMSINKK